jgi:hypothetical protein
MVAMVTAAASAAMAGPALAGGTMRVVDDDGRASPGNCGSSATARTSIQKAVAASSANDIVLVCPGVYREQVIIGAAKDGLEVRSTKAHAAIVRSPASLTGADAIIRINAGAADVTLSKLAVRHVAPLLSTAGGSDCAVSEGILVRGTGATLTGLRVFAEGEGTLGDCALRSGIVVRNDGPASATVTGSVVKDIHQYGIEARGVGAALTARANTVQYHHVSAPDEGANGRGIVIHEGASGVIRDNLVASHSSASPATDGPGDTINNGIDVEVGALPVVVRGNTVRRAYNGIRVEDSSATVSHAAVTVRENTVTDSRQGIFVDGGTHVVRANTLTGNRFGIFVRTPTTDGLFEDNVATGSVVTDCTDQTSGSGTGNTANTWTNNTGAVASPPEICSA